MIQLNKVFVFFISLFLFTHVHAQVANVPVVQTVIQKGFPVQPDELLKTTHALFSEYKSQKNVSSLIFYSYGMLRLANHFKALNDYVNASEYAKLGFFYLDEAVDTHENDMRVRYLRARVDAYLPADLGRCVVTLYDTDILLKEKKQFDHDVLAQIQYMRYRALLSCKENKKADVLLAQMKKASPSQIKLLSLGVESTPEWDVNEITQVVMPLVKGE
ncbi:hypothetical protein [Neisseria sp. Ec49-e6-T10]|uniref:hypothetical protein n=1 Tax=Neisseria sp. Ec49-e6-T10 TaxID=3140744 RepID=UPI003EB8CF44